MRIAILTEGYLPELSGVTTSLQRRLQCLSAAGHAVRVYAPDYAPLAKLYPDHRAHVGRVFDNVEVVPFESVPYYVDYTRDPRPFSFGRVARDLEAFAPDVVHAECPERLFMGFLARPGVDFARRRGVPATAFYHTNYLAYAEDYKDTVRWLGLPGVTRALRGVMVWVYNSFDVTMVPSPVTAAYVAGEGVRNVRCDRFLGIDVARFTPAAERPPGPVRLLYVGRLTADKQIDVLLRAFTALRADGRFSFTFIGGGPEETSVRAWAGGRPDVRVVGRVAPDVIADHYRDADLFVTASTRENHPLTVLEAMASGLPVVAPAAGGMTAMIDDGRDGALVAPGDAAALARAVTRLADDPDVLAKAGRAARERALGASWEAATQNMVRVWEGLRRR